LYLGTLAEAGWRQEQQAWPIRRSRACAARLDARTLWSFGLKKAAVARLCLNGDIYRAMPEVCHRYLPPPAPGSGDIWLVEGATGKNRLCNDYDVTQQLCRVWAHVAHHSTPKKKATVSRETSATLL
jgi:hypothetical protein